MEVLRWNHPSFFYGVGPNKNSDEQTPFTNLKNLTPHSETIYYQLFTKLNFFNNMEPTQQIEGQILLEFSKDINIQNNFSFLSNFTNNNHSRGLGKESLYGWSGYLNSSFLNFNYDNGHLLLGKTNIFLNTFSENLLFNGEYLPNSAFWWHHDSRYWKYDYGLQFLDVIPDENNSSIYGRFISFHRYTYSGPSYSISFTEAGIARFNDFVRDGLKYALPAGMITETEINDGGSNLFWFLDGYYQFNNIFFYGEFLIDDYALDKGSPHKLAFKVGGRYSSKKNKIQLEYLRINRWVGNYLYPELQMIEDETLLGHPIGPDAHKLSLNLNNQLSKNIILNSKLYFIESGQGKIDETWPVNTAQTNFGYFKEAFPSGRIKGYSGIAINPIIIIGESIIVDYNIKYEIDSIDTQISIYLIY